MRNNLFRAVLASTLVVLPLQLAAQDSTPPAARPGVAEVAAANRGPAAPAYVSPEVNTDGTATFRTYAPNAKVVEVSIEGSAKPMAQDPATPGLWTVTTDAYKPDIYSYRFRIDGAWVLDTKNPVVQNNLQELVNTFTVHGASPLPWEPQDIPHGEVSLHIYSSKVVLGLPANQDHYYVYTPPGYDPKAKQAYPVLYLLHGFSDDADGWTSAGHANLIFDSLIHDGKIKQMVVVMTLGYGNLAVLKPGRRDPGVSGQSVTLFQQMLLTEVLPQVEASYHVAKDRNHRAIAGLSMGGQESLLTGLNHTDLFAYIGTFSAGVNANTLTQLPKLTPQQANLKVLWMACGVDDALLKPNRDVIAALKTQGFSVTAIETPGHHQWPVWRDNLLHFTPLLFQ